LGGVGAGSAKVKDISVVVVLAGNPVNVATTV
jgi:hypothetical protein